MTARLLAALPADVAELLTPTPAGETAHNFRVSRINQITELSFNSTSPFLQRDAIVDTFFHTQFDRENHRRNTPFLQAIWADRATFMDRLDNVALRESRDTFDGYSGYSFDVIIIGSGPHGAAVASYLRERYPTLRTMIVESGVLGGQFRSYGPKPAFLMNSRVRQADRTRPARPRSSGSINPLGKYAMLELSDVAMGNYATNVEMGDVCAVNAWVSVNATLVGCKAVQVIQSEFDSTRSVEVQDSLGRFRGFTAKVVVDATGITNRSALGPENRIGFSGGSAPTSFDLTRASGRYFDTGSFYRHIASNANPLAAFQNRDVTVVGAGDSALTALEALIGNMPMSYGQLGAGKHRPATITWVGAPGNYASTVERCLRTRYKNGIVQALPRDSFDTSALIKPMFGVLGSTVELTRSGVELGIRSNPRKKRGYFGPGRLQTDVLIDCTAVEVPKLAREDWQPDFEVGPGCYQSQAIRDTIRRLKVPENTASLWATMEQTDLTSEEIGRSLTPINT